MKTIGTLVRTRAVTGTAVSIVATPIRRISRYVGKIYHDERDWIERHHAENNWDKLSPQEKYEATARFKLNKDTLLKAVVYYMEDVRKYDQTSSDNLLARHGKKLWETIKDIKVFYGHQRGYDELKKLYDKES